MNKNHKEKLKKYKKFFKYLLIVGFILVFWGGLEVFDTGFNRPDLRTNYLSFSSPVPYCIEYPNPCEIGNSHVYAITPIFTANDIFAVNNRIEADILVTVIDPQDINQIIGVVLTKKSDTSWVNDPQKLKDHIKFFNETKTMFTGGWQSNDLYKLHFHLVPDSEVEHTVWIFLQTKTDGKWFAYNDLDFPTIYPASAWDELKSSRVIEGLTFVIIGCIPIGIVAEFKIEYSIENYFYREEKREKRILPRTPVNFSSSEDTHSE